MNERKRDNRMIIFFLVINLFLLPTVYKDIKKMCEKTSVINENIKEEKNTSKIITIWINNIFKEDVKEAYITDNTGEIVVDDVGKIKSLNLDNSIKVNDININSDKKYKLGVSLNE